MADGLKIAPGLALKPEHALQRFGILAMSGAGKSNAAVVFAEEMYDAGIPWVAIDPKGDWWGVRSSKSGKGDGLKVPVFGGLKGDVPLEETAGKLIAGLVASKRLTCVLDISEMSKGAQLRFLTDFAETLLRESYSKGSSSFSTTLSLLRRNKLIADVGGELVASEDLFIGSMVGSRG